MDKERFVYNVAGADVKIALGGKNFTMDVYDCVQKKFFSVLRIECKGRTVHVHIDEEWSKDVLLYV